jgi:hypothetical protein
MTPLLSSSDKSLTLLSQLLLCPGPEDRRASFQVSLKEFDELLTLADSHHVVMRSMEVFCLIMSAARDGNRTKWAVKAIERENERIENALAFLQVICDTLESEGCDVTVIKSLDHWPDLGSDLDLYTNAKPEKVTQVLKQRFKADTAPRSWGDRLANKWNFIVPGLPELVEVHMGRLGQMGEQVTIASSVATRSRSAEVGNHIFRVPAAVDRLMISTLQRMYRHFYLRLCDVVDTANLLESGKVDYDQLRSSAKAAGIWEGVATYLAVVSDHVANYRGDGIDLPAFVRQSATFGGDRLRFRRGFLRVPILPDSARLYAAQLTTFLRNGELRNTARLSLLPCLATAAAVGQKITGSDKGIW